MELTKRRKHAFNRLARKLGVLIEADDYKEQLREDGLSNQEAYELAEEKYFPKDWFKGMEHSASEKNEIKERAARLVTVDREVEEEDLSDAELEHLKDVSGGEVDLRADLEWAYSNHLNADLSAVDAPSPGAWSLVVFAKMNPTKFMELAIKLLSTKKTTDSEDRWNDKCPEVLELVEKLLDEERQISKERNGSNRNRTIEASRR